MRDWSGFRMLQACFSRALPTCIGRLPPMCGGERPERLRRFHVERSAPEHHVGPAGWVVHPSACSDPAAGASVLSLGGWNVCESSGIISSRAHFLAHGGPQNVGCPSRFMYPSCCHVTASRVRVAWDFPHSSHFIMGSPFAQKKPAGNCDTPEAGLCSGSSCSRSVTAALLPQGRPPCQGGFSVRSWRRPCGNMFRQARCCVHAVCASQFRQPISVAPSQRTSPGGQCRWAQSRVCPGAKKARRKL